MKRKEKEQAVDREVFSTWQEMVIQDNGLCYMYVCIYTLKYEK